MPNRTAKFVSAIFASLLAGAALTTIPHSTAGAADDCLSGPTGETSEGNHWYYRVDRVTKRHCWYIREEREKLSQTAPSTATSSAKPVAGKTEPTMQRSVADARAELPAPTLFEQPGRGDELARAISTDTATRDNDGATPMPGAASPGSVIASRWPDPSGSASPIEPAPIRRDAVAGVNPPPRPQAPSVIAAGVAADASSQPAAYSMQMHLAALMAALALAGMLGGVAFKLAFPGRPVRPNLRARSDPGAIWEPTDDDRIVLPAHPETDAPAQRPGFARGVSRSRSADDRIAEFFSALSRRATT